jgi:hypothetical protein
MKNVLLGVCICLLVGCASKFVPSEQQGSSIYYPPTQEELKVRAEAEKKEAKERDWKKVCSFLEVLLLSQGNSDYATCNDPLDALK